MLQIDGASGEGGGQVLRSSLALSMVTGQPFRIRGIRANRARPGLLRQHLTAVQAAAAISSAEVTGDAMRSEELTFSPGPIAPGQYRFVVGTAGSAHLVLQTVLPALLRADRPTEIVLEGGTHNQAAPPFHFLKEAYLPQLASMGPRVDLTLERWGFYPAGGGRVRATITPSALSPLVLEERGALHQIEVVAVLSRLRRQIGTRELGAVSARLALDKGATRIQQVDSDGPGNVVLAFCRAAHVTEVFSAFGRRRVTAEAVGTELAEAVATWRARDVPVGEHLADQLLLPIALAGEGAFVTGPPSLHTTTQIDVIAQFLGRRFTIRELGQERYRASLGL